MKPGNNDPNQKKGPKFNIYWIYGIIIMVIIGVQFFGGNLNSMSNEYGFQDFKAYNDKDQVAKLKLINNDHVEVYLKKGVPLPAVTSQGKTVSPGVSNEKTPAFEFKIGSVEQFGLDMAEAEKGRPNHVNIIYETQQDYSKIFQFVLPIIFVVALWFLLFRKMGNGGGAGGAGGIFNIGKSKAQLFEKGTRVNITFNDVAGLDEAKVEVMEIVDFLKNPKKYTALGGKIPKGAFLVGPP